MLDICRASFATTGLPEILTFTRKGRCGNVFSVESHKNIAKAVGIIALATIFSRFAGLGREVVTANFFGTTIVYNAFIIAFTLSLVATLSLVILSIIGISLFSHFFHFSALSARAFYECLGR